MENISFTAANRVLIQGLTEPMGLLYVPLMQAYGTAIVAGVSPGFGSRAYWGIPMFDLVEDAITSVGMVDTTIIFVSPYQALDAALEAIAAGIRQIVLITAGIPPLDMVRLIRKAEATETLVVGPHSPGIIVPGQLLLGTHPTSFYTPGSVGLLTRSDTLTYEVALELTRAGLGQSIAVGIGSDRVIGSSFPQWLQMLEEDDQTEVIVLVGEIGSDSEEMAARYIVEAIDKPVIAYIAGQTVPWQHPLGHVESAIAARMSGLRPATGTAESKIAAFKQANIPLAECPSQIPHLVKKALQPVAKKRKVMSS